MKTLIGLKKWNFKNALIFSIILILFYVACNLIYIRIFGSESEIVWNLKLTKEITKTITLHWNSWFNTIPNAFGFLCFSLILLKDLSHIYSRTEKRKVKEIDLTLRLSIGAIYGFFFGIGVTPLYGFAAALVLTLFIVFVFGLKTETFYGALFGLIFGLTIELGFGLSLGLASLTAFISKIILSRKYNQIKLMILILLGAIFVMAKHEFSSRKRIMRDTAGHHFEKVENKN